MPYRIMLPIPPRVTSPRHWLLGPAYYAQRDPLRVIPQWIRECGDIFTITSPLGKAAVVATPELAHQVLVARSARYQKKSRAYAVLRLLLGNGLVTSEGEFWRGQRKLVQPAFHRRRLDALFGMMVERVTDCIERLALDASGTVPVDMTPILSHLTLDIIARAMFSSDVAGSAADVSRHIAILNQYALRLLRQPWLFLLPRGIPTPFNGAQVRSFRGLNRIVADIIQARRKEPGAHDDLLAMLLSAVEEGTGRGMTDEQLRDEVMTIFVAGHETTANAMAWLLHLVSQNSAIEERLLEEIDAHWPAGGLTLESLGAFPYVRQVIEESLRIYPSIWSIGRQCTKEDELGGYRIPVGMNVVVPIFYFHWSERYWDEPGEFEPSRFAPRHRPSAEPLIYFPFGAGPRSCIGNHFALQELMILTILLHRNYQFLSVPGFRVEPDPLITLRPRYGMQLQVRPRSEHRTSPQESEPRGN
ncbi:MAG: cytochrome P450 [Pedosphaera sp.]|nr:cytochrome P450 [Pedosphaera sp.]